MPPVPVQTVLDLPPSHPRTAQPALPVITRPRRPVDLPRIVQLMARVYPPPDPAEAVWTAALLMEHLRRFPEGQIVAETADGRIVGDSTSLWEAFEDQVASLVAAADYRCDLVVFPEYFTIQLLTLGNVKRPMPDQVLELARQRPRYLDMFIRLSAKYRITIVGGSIPSLGDGGRVYNDCFLFSPEGRFASQGKLHMTRFEKEEWLVSGRDRFSVFDTALGRIAITVCYDVEFPEVVRGAARAGARILVVPSCTDDRQGFLRVRYCAQARAIENQMYVIHSGTVGSMPAIPAVFLNYGQAAILTPSDFPFSRDGIRAEGVPNQEQIVIGDLDMEILEDQAATSMNTGAFTRPRSGNATTHPATRTGKFRRSSCRIRWGGKGSGL